MQHESYAVIITGPTASGKTALAEKLALECSGRIINADVGQFYTPLSVGTAKPDLHACPVPYALFDIVSEPHDISVARYRSLVSAELKVCLSRSQTPIIVGGSLFYIASLFFPPHEMATYLNPAQRQDSSEELADTQLLWDRLKTIDPDRADAIHPHDRYRIIRALTIWQSTGIKPSLMRPVFDPIVKRVIVITLEPETSVLYENINQRTSDMIIYGGWAQECEQLINTPWQAFVEKKGLIGYKEMFQWILADKPANALDGLITLIAQKTRNYARRQLIFLQKFKKEVVAESKKHQQITLFKESAGGKGCLLEIIQFVIDNLFGCR